MTTAENKCCVSLAMKLKELGIPQKSEWYWVNFNDGKVCQLRYRDGIYEFEHNNWVFHSAFTTSELMKKLPSDTRLYKHGDLWICISPKIEEGGGWFQQADKRIADAPARMLIFMIKNKLIKELK